MAFLIQRLRRLRQHEAVRRMVRETSLTLSDLIYPLFVVEERDRREVIAKVMRTETVAGTVFAPGKMGSLLDFVL